MPDQVEYLNNLAGEEVAQFQRQAQDIMQQGVAKMSELGITSTEPAVDLLSLTAVPVQGLSPTLTVIALDYSADLIQQISEQTLQRINGELTRAILGEMNPYQAMQKVDQAMGMTGFGVSNKAEKIVRTELTRAYGANTKAQNDITIDRIPEQYRSLVTKTWHWTHDNRTREEHRLSPEQATVPYDMPFMVGGEELDYPGDPKGSAWNIINCRCYVTYDYSAAVEAMAAEAEEA